MIRLCSHIRVYTGLSARQEVSMFAALGDELVWEVLRRLQPEERCDVMLSTPGLLRPPAARCGSGCKVGADRSPRSPCRRTCVQAWGGACLPPLGEYGAPKPPQSVPRIPRAAAGRQRVVGSACPGIEPASGGGGAVAAPDDAACVASRRRWRLLGHPGLLFTGRHASSYNVGAPWRPWAATGGCAVPAAWLRWHAGDNHAMQH